MKLDRKKRTLHKKIAVGYLIIVLLISGTVCTYLYEWNRMQTLEKENGDIRCLRSDIQEAYAKFVDLSFISETVMEWNDTDLLTYRSLRMELDSLLCHLKKYDRNHRIDSVRLLLETKESLLYQINQAMTRHEEATQQIAQQVPGLCSSTPRSIFSYSTTGRKKQSPRLHPKDDETSYNPRVTTNTHLQHPPVA